MARGYEPPGERGAAGGIASREDIQFLGQSAALGTGTVPELIRETDPDVLLAMQAVNLAAMEYREAELKRLAHYIGEVLAKVWG